MLAQWETINTEQNDITQRMPVPGGWLVCRLSGFHAPLSPCSWFVSDPDHLWNIEP